MRRVPLLAVVTVALTAGPAAATPTIDSLVVAPLGSWTSSPTLTAAWSIQAPPFLSGIRIEVNAATDGSADGTWIPIHTTSPILSPTATMSMPLGTIEGRRAVRAVAWDQDGQLVRFLGTAYLDRSATLVTRPGVQVDGPHRFTIGWTADDQGASGATPDATIEVEVDADGSADGPWITRAVPGGEGPKSAVVDVAELVDGAHRARLRQSDAAGNTALVDLPPIVVDRRPPQIDGLHVLRAPTTDRPSAQIGYVASDLPGALPADTTVRVVDADRGTTYAQAPSGPGAQVVWVDLPAAVSTRLVLEIADAAGNIGRSAPIRVEPTSLPLGAAQPADPRAAEFAAARLDVAAPGPLRRLRAGTTIQVAGRLTSAAGQPLTGVAVEARDRAGRTAGQATTTADGSFALVARPLASGVVSVGVPWEDGLLPRAAPVANVVVEPRITLRVSRTTARAGGPAVVFQGRVYPSPAALGVRTKNVVLEWRDPLRGQWRPMQNSRLRPDGTVRLAWTFGVGGFRVPVRLRLPAEPGWPTQCGRSRTVTIVVK